MSGLEAGADAGENIGSRLETGWRARAQSFAADTHFLSGFSAVDVEPFSFSHFANCSRT